MYGDIAAARDALLPGGIVVLDDFRSEHTPGVSIAAWEAVLNRGLHPICLSTQKLYATWDDPETVQEELLAMLEGRDDCHLSLQEAAGHRIIRLKSKGMKAPEFPVSRHYVEKAPEVRQAPPKAPEPKKAAVPVAHTGPKPLPRRATRIAFDLLPPVVTRAIRRARRSGPKAQAKR